LVAWKNNGANQSDVLVLLCPMVVLTIDIFRDGSSRNLIYHWVGYDSNQFENPFYFGFRQLR
jgi:hypothetical protein